MPALWPGKGAWFWNHLDVTWRWKVTPVHFNETGEVERLDRWLFTSVFTHTKMTVTMKQLFSSFVSHILYFPVDVFEEKANENIKHRIIIYPADVLSFHVLFVRFRSLDDNRICCLSTAARTGRSWGRRVRGQVWGLPWADTKPGWRCRRHERIANCEGERVSDSCWQQLFLPLKLNKAELGRDYSLWN